ncbi:MAG: M48 family metallopeptidase [Chthonomonadaceae bacterium]|nr:M48 family metallopeptidase [Chthonomonadaceae bacterium]
MRLRVEDGAVEVVVPRRGNRLDAIRMLEVNASWILKHTSRQNQDRIEDHSAVWFQGERWLVRVEPYGKASVSCSEGQIVVSGPAPSDALQAWLKDQSSLALHGTLERRCQDMQLAPKRVQIRDQKSKWGACTSRGTITLSWRLVMAPMDVLDYVVVHELAHLREMNHSQRFWNIVSRHCPEFQTHRAWLRRNGSRLVVPDLNPQEIIES